MFDSTYEPSKRLLEPIERISEILFGLIMALTFTCTISAASAGQADVRAVLLGALGCNLAWGIVDGAIYLITTLAERARGVAMLRAVQQAASAADAHRIIAAALPPVVADAVDPAGLEAIQHRLKQLPAPPAFARLHGRDLLGAVAIFVLVFLSTFPVALPFMFIQSITLAMRVSNGIAMLMLFAVGHALGRYACQRAWRMGVVMLVAGSVLVVVTIALGG